MNQSSATNRRSLELLASEIDAGRSNAVEIDLALSRLSDEERTVENLLLLLSDRAIDDEGMFSIIHMAEAVSDARYVSGLLSVVSRLTDKAPRWASIVLTRVLNSDAARHELAAQLRVSSVASQETVRRICSRINQKLEFP